MSDKLKAVPRPHKMGHDDVLAALRRELESAEKWGDVRRVIIITENEGGEVFHRHNGNTKNTELIGLLEIVKANFLASGRTG